jgi:voltage-gated potassium channel Kch
LCQAGFTTAGEDCHEPIAHDFWSELERGSRSRCTINSSMPTLLSQKPPSYFRVAWQSAIAAALSLGLPAGLSLWLILLLQIYKSSVVESLSGFLQAHGIYRIYIVSISSILWGYLLGRISGYRPWWRIGLASAVAILVAWFSPLANVDGILYEYRPSLPIHLNYAAAMVGLIGGVTFFVGLAYGIILRSIKAALTMALTTSVVSVLTLLLTIIVFNQFGIRVGTGNFAMSKVTVAGLLTSSITGGMALGIGFNRFVERDNGSRIRSTQNLDQYVQ